MTFPALSVILRTSHSEADRGVQAVLGTLGLSAREIPGTGLVPGTVISRKLQNNIEFAGRSSGLPVRGGTRFKCLHGEEFAGRGPGQFGISCCLPSPQSHPRANRDFMKLTRHSWKGDESVEARIVLLPGDGIGPEVVAEGRRVLDAIAARFGHRFQFESCLMGGCAIDATGSPLPDSTLAACRASAAVLLGAVGGPKWDDPGAKTRPEAGLLKIRKELGLFANLRPIKPSRYLLSASPLRTEILEGTDILFVRELTGGIYFGESGLRPHPSGHEAFNVMLYNTAEIERVVRVSAEAARKRRGKLTMVDKANVLEASRLWRSVTARLMREEFSDLQYDVVLVDAMAMHLLSRPRDFDVVVTENLFGDILTDEGSMLTGSMGLLPSASLGSSGPGLYEPIHGSAPDIAGRGIANPLATILAAAMLLRHSLQLETEAQTVENAVDEVLRQGCRTKDIAAGGPSLGTREMGDRVVQILQQK